MFLIRIDDYPTGVRPILPDHIDRLGKVLKAFEDRGVPYLLGVVPELLEKADYEFLGSLKHATIALHGCDHLYGRWKEGDPDNEFLGLSYDEVDQKVTSGLAKLAQWAPQAYIPPFNTVTNELLDVLHEKGVQLICTSEHTGYERFPSAGKLREVRTPTPLYGRTPGLVELIKQNRQTLDSGDFCICLHVTWEDDEVVAGSSALEEFLDLVAPTTMSWERLLTPKAQPEPKPAAAKATAKAKKAVKAKAKSGPVKILHITEQLSKGGAGRSLIANAKYSARLGEFEHKVISIAPIRDGVNTEGLEVLQAPSLERVRTEIEAADIVQWHWWEDIPLMREKLPEHYALLVCHTSGNRAPHQLTSFEINFANHIVAVCEHSLTLPVFKSIDPDKLSMIYMGADFERVLPARRIPHNGFTTGWIGTVDDNRYPVDFLQVHDGIDIPDLKVLMLGMGPMWLQVHDQIHNLGLTDKFKMLGYREDMRGVYGRLDVYGMLLNPSTTAAAELNLQEAMASALPIVMLPIGGPQYMIENGVSGIVAADTREYQQAMEYLYHHPEERERLGTNAREQALRRFGAENSARQLNELYGKICAKKPAKPKAKAAPKRSTAKKPNYRVSAIVSTYNSERFMRGCLDDLIAQTLYQKGELEIVVVNTGSEQNERQIVEEYKAKYDHITHIYIPERERMYAAWNRGIKGASGKYVTSANTDDRHRVDALEKMADTLDSRSDIALVYADCDITTQENARFGEAPIKGTFKWLEFDPKSLFMACYMGPQPMWRRSLHETYGYFEPDFKSAGDYEFWLRMCKTEKFLHIPETLGLYLESPTSVEHSNQEAAAREVLTALDRHWPKEWGPRPAPGVQNALAASKAAQAAAQKPAAPRRKGQPTLSLCMIVRDEEKFIGQCLESAKSIVDEIIIVDTGSSDRTVDIAKSYGAKVFEFPWNDSYSDARNESIRHASCDWILVLDADEQLDPGTLSVIRQEIAKPQADGYNLLFRNVITDGSAPDLTVHRVCRLFRNDSRYHYESRIHEHIEECIMRSGGSLMPLDVVVHHFGYKPEIVAERGKHEKYVRMLEAELAERPDDVFYLHHLSAALCAGHEFEKAIPYMYRACDIVDPKSAFGALIFSHLVNALRELGRNEEGLEVVERAEKLGVSYPQLSFCKANVLLLLHRPAEALKAFEEAIKLGRGKAWTGDSGTAGYKADFGIATAHFQLGHYSKAVKYALSTLDQKPDNIPAIDLLTQIAKATGDDAMLEKYLLQLRALLPGDPKPAICIGELYERQNRLHEAVEHYSALINIGEETATLRVKLGNLAEAQGRMDEAESHYLRAIEIDCAEPGTHNALGLLRAAQGQYQSALDSFATAIEVAPSCANSYFNAGDVLYSAGDYTQAADLYQAGLAHNPTHAPAFLRLGNCYMHTGVPEAAVIAYEQALTIDPDYADAANNLAMARDTQAAAKAA